MGCSSRLARDHPVFVRALDDCLREAESTCRQGAVDRDRVMAILTAFSGPNGGPRAQRASDRARKGYAWRQYWGSAGGREVCAAPLAGPGASPRPQAVRHRR